VPATRALLCLPVPLYAAQGLRLPGPYAKKHGI